MNPEQGDRVMKMVKSTLLIGITLATRIIYAEQEFFKVIVEPHWHNLEQNEKRTEEFGGKWILAGSITFKKHCKDAVFLDNIQLSWKGEKIDHLIGSLYEKNEAGEFLPIDKYLVCDSCWKKSTQELFLRFNRPCTLGAINTFYLVLTVPEKLEPILKNGSFYVEQAGLPLPYREYLKEHTRALALRTCTSHTLTA
jgi:hypothetical protein